MLRSTHLVGDLERLADLVAVIDHGRAAHDVWKGLLWWDFRRHRQGFVIGLPTIALAAMMIGMVENVAGPWFLWGGLVMGAATGIGFGLGESSLCYEEYSLGLQPARRDRYYVRFFLGLAFLFVLLVVGLAAGPLGWVRSFWELLPVELPRYQPDAELWRGFQGVGYFFLSVGLGFATFVESYAVSMQVGRSVRTNWVGKFAPFVVGAAALVALDLELFGGDPGYLTCGVALVYGLLQIESGCRRFESKDGSSTGRAPSARRVLAPVWP